MNCRRYIHRFLRYFGLVAVLVAAALGATWQWLSTQGHVYVSHGVLELTRDQQLDGNRVESGVFDTTVESLTGEAFLLRVAKKIGLTETVANSAAGGQMTAAQESKVVETLRKHLKVSRRKGTWLIDIVAEESSPERARQLVAAVMETSVDDLKAQKHELTRKAKDSLRGEVEKMQRELSALEKELKDYRELHPVPDSDLPRRVDSAREYLTTLTNHLRTITLAEDESPIPVRVAEEPLANMSPVRPSKGKIMLIAGLAALLFGLGLNFLIDRFDSSTQKSGGN